eukprot:3928736-Pleurochrysis_carterae.AAC.2
MPQSQIFNVENALEPRVRRGCEKRRRAPQVREEEGVELRALPRAAPCCQRVDRLGVPRLSRAHTPAGGKAAHWARGKAAQWAPHAQRRNPTGGGGTGAAGGA